MTRKLGVLGSLALVALLLVTFSGTALAQPPTPTTPYRGFGFLDRVTLQRVANLLGATPNDVWAQLQQGKSLAQIAQAKGVTEKALTDAILQPLKDRLALQVKYGYLAQAQADAQLQYQEARIKELISTTPGPYGEDGYGYGWACPMHGGGWGGFGGMMGSFGGMMGFGGRGVVGWW